MSTTTLTIIQNKFPGRIILSVEELSKLLCMNPYYIRREVRAGRFLIPCRRIGNRIMFPVGAIIDALDGNDTPQKRGPGRPRKTA